MNNVLGVSGSLPFTGSFSYDSNAQFVSSLTSQPPDGGVCTAFYQLAPPLGLYHVPISFNGWTFRDDPGQPLWLRVQDATQPSTLIDAFSVYSNDVVSPVQIAVPVSWEFELAFFDYSGGLFSNTDIPASLVLSDYTWPHVVVQPWATGGSLWAFTGTIDTINIPEPASAPAVLFVLGGLILITVKGRATRFAKVLFVNAG